MGGQSKAEPLLKPRVSLQDSVQQQTLQAIGQLATRRYQPRARPAPRWDSASSCSSAPVCAICLEEFSEGQVGFGQDCCTHGSGFPGGGGQQWELRMAGARGL